MSHCASRLWLIIADHSWFAAARKATQAAATEYILKQAVGQRELVCVSRKYGVEKGFQAVAPLVNEEEMDLLKCRISKAHQETSDFKWAITTAVQSVFSHVNEFEGDVELKTAAVEALEVWLELISQFDVSCCIHCVI